MSMKSLSIVPLLPNTLQATFTLPDQRKGQEPMVMIVSVQREWPTDDSFGSDYCNSWYNVTTSTGLYAGRATDWDVNRAIEQFVGAAGWQEAELSPVHQLWQAVKAMLFVHYPVPPKPIQQDADEGDV